MYTYPLEILQINDNILPSSVGNLPQHPQILGFYPPSALNIQPTHPAGQIVLIFRSILGSRVVICGECTLITTWSRPSDIILKKVFNLGCGRVSKLFEDRIEPTELTRLFLIVYLKRFQTCKRQCVPFTATATRHTCTLATGITLAPASLVAILVTDFLASKGVYRVNMVAPAGSDVPGELTFCKCLAVRMKSEEEKEMWGITKRYCPRCKHAKIRARRVYSRLWRIINLELPLLSSSCSRPIIDQVV